MITSFRNVIQQWRRRARWARMPIVRQPLRHAMHHSILTWERGHVRAAVIELGDGAAELLGVSVVPVHGLDGRHHPDVDRWFVGCQAALTQAEDMTALTGRKWVPNQLTMCVSSEITRSLPVSVTWQRKQAEEPIAFEELGLLLQRCYRRAQDLLDVQGRTREDIVWGTVTELRLDGQRVPYPLGLRGEKVEARVHFSLAPLEWLRALEVVAERLEVGLSGIIPENVVYAAALGDVPALLILLDEHHTSISLVRGGQLQWSTLVPVGEKEITGGTAEALELQGRQADLLMRAFRSQQLSYSVEQALARAYWAELRRWMYTMADGVTALHGAERQNGDAVEPLPATVYFADISRHVPEAFPSLGTPFWERCLPFERCPEPVALSVSTVRDVLDCTTQASEPAFLLLRALARYVAQLNAPGDNLDRTLAEMIRWRRGMPSAQSH
ncbi:MAG TPA: hypothetical protein GX714_15690 [Chloroflexi bacterium]|jgi:hypothetical protein|nr:hypothetical protein [Chloroflexota bacterium]